MTLGSAVGPGRGPYGLGAHPGLRHGGRWLAARKSHPEGPERPQIRWLEGTSRSGQTLTKLPRPIHLCVDLRIRHGQAASWGSPHEVNPARNSLALEYNRPGARTRGAGAKAGAIWTVDRNGCHSHKIFPAGKYSRREDYFRLKAILAPGRRHKRFEPAFPTGGLSRFVVRAQDIGNLCGQPASER